jgi:hypothetical protein
VITCPATLDVPRELAQYLGRLLRAHRRDRGTRKSTRALTCYSAPMSPRWHVITASPVPPGYRYLDEVITVLANQAPDLHEALERAKTDGLAHVILDGKIFSAGRLAEKTTSVKGKQIDLWYSGKAHEPGGNIQALLAPNGFPLWGQRCRTRLGARSDRRP